MTVIRRRTGPRPPTWQQRAQQLEQKLLGERQQHLVDIDELQRLLAIEREARAMRDGQVMVLERTAEGLRGQLLSKRRELARFMRTHGAGDQVLDDPDAP